LKTGGLALTRDLLRQVDDKKPRKSRRLRVQWLLSVAILAQWWHLVASNKALNLLYQAMRAVLYRHTTAAIKMASKVIYFAVAVLFAVALAAAGVIRSE
jgi:hypothetical protein